MCLYNYLDLVLNLFCRTHNRSIAHASGNSPHLKALFKISTRPCPIILKADSYISYTGSSSPGDVSRGRFWVTYIDSFNVITEASLSLYVFSPVPWQQVDRDLLSFSQHKIEIHYWPMAFDTYLSEKAVPSNIGNSFRKYIRMTLTNGKC